MYLEGFKQPVFPFTLVDQHLTNYFMTRDGAIISTASGTSRQLSGSIASGTRYYTLNKRTFSGPALKMRALQHPSFKTETTDAPAAVKPVEATLPADRTTSPRKAAEIKGFVLATLSPGDKLVFGTTPVFHASEVSAKQEAERVASTTGGEIVVLKIVGKVKVQKAVWE